MGAAEVGQAFVIGAQRCGTTSITTALEHNPQVAVARPRRPEPKVFLDPAAADDVDGYLRRFYAHAGPAVRLRLEKSTSYLEHEVACAGITRAFPDAHVVVVLRDPVDRAVSQYGFSVDQGVETLAVDEALTPEAERRPWDTTAISVSPYRYLSRGRYVDDLRRWFVAVDRDRLHVVVLEDLLADPERFDDLERGLGLDPGSGFGPDERHNAGEGDVTLDDDTRTRLAAWYADANADLAELLGRPLDRWTRP
jgi:hypothetical protein